LLRQSRSTALQKITRNERDPHGIIITTHRGPPAVSLLTKILSRLPNYLPLQYVMLVIGVAGGVASGKSVVSQELRRLGAELLDADKIGHEVLEEPAVRDAICREWGAEVLSPDGKVNRAALARRVFALPPQGPRELAVLEQITHPRIGVRLKTEIERLAAAGRCPAAVLDAAVMFKAGWHRHCDRILYVEAPREIRLQRALQRGWTAEHFAAREAAQLSVEEKKQLADTIIDNSGALSHTIHQVERFWRSLGLKKS
jgi:dephospho-CoA kinase